MNRGINLWEGLQGHEREEIEYRVQEAMTHRQLLTMIVGETDGEHTVEAHVIDYKSETRSLQISNEWGRFHIPIANIVRVLN